MVGSVEVKGGLSIGVTRRAVLPALVTLAQWPFALLRKSRDLFNSGTVVIIVLLAASICALQVGTGASNNPGVHSPDPSAVLASLYAAVPERGYISVATSSLTDPRVVVELVRAKKRGVNVRIIADRQKLADKRDKIALYNLRHYGIPVKVNIGPEPIALRVSIVNDVYVATGTYEYSPCRTSDCALTVTPAADDDLLRNYKEAFNSRWDDERSYKSL